MDDYLINGETLENIADKIREKAPDAYEGNTVTPEEMPDAVDEVWQAGYNEGSKSVDLSPYQTKHDENLETESKEISGAINEVNETANNAKNTLQQIIDGDVPVSEAIRADGLAYEEVTLKTKNKKTLGAINEINDKTVDKVKSIDTWAGGVRDLYTDDGISWREGYAFNNAPELEGDDISNGDIFHRIPIVAGNGIEFENDGQLITINATGGGSTEQMPQIRFVSMPCDGWLGHMYWEESDGTQDETYENLKFTIEIVGGGALKVGDAIQLCRMGHYGIWVEPITRKVYPQKRKLRRLFEYVITEDDLDKRFITFEVPWNDKKAIKLFTKWATKGVNDKTIYFRIRRAKGEINSGSNGGGMTVDAEFSNVVSIRCLSYGFTWYAPDDEEIRFYQIRIT